MTRAREISNVLGRNIESTTFTATAGQTAFSITHAAGRIQVYMNGLLLDPTVDWTSDGSTVTLTEGAIAGDELEVVKFDNLAVADVVPATGGTFSGDVTLSGNLLYDDVSQLYGDGTQSNPFKGLEGATEYSKVHSIADGTYYVEFDGTSYQAPFVFENYMANSLHYHKPTPRAWMKVTSAVASITSLSAGSGISLSGDVNAQLSSSGVVTMDYIENSGCGETHCTYDIDLVDGCHFNLIQLNYYRPHSIHQCLNLYTYRNTDFTRDSGEPAAKLIGLFGAATVSEFASGGTFTQASNDPSVDGGGVGVAQCSWSSQIHATNNGGNASTTSYDHLAVCAFYQTPKAFTNLVLHFNCASESTIAQTNTTHEYWVAV